MSRYEKAVLAVNLFLMLRRERLDLLEETERSLGSAKMEGRMARRYADRFAAADKAEEAKERLSFIMEVHSYIPW